MAFRNQAAARVSETGTRSSASSVPATVKEAPPGTARGLPNAGAVGQVTAPSAGAQANRELNANPAQAAAVAAAAGAASSATPAAVAPAPAGGKRLKQTLKAFARQGLDVTLVLVRKLGPSLPSPGAEAANLVLALLTWVDTALVNAADLEDLRDRALAFLDILDAYHGELLKLRLYEQVVLEYIEHLKAIVEYAKQYSSWGLLVQLLKAGSSARALEELAARMGALGEQVMTLVAVDTNARLQEVQDVVEESRNLLLRMAEYKDPLAAAREFVEQHGGLEAVQRAGELDTVVAKLPISHQVVIKMVRVQVSSLLQMLLDNGPHQQIPHPDLRLFWVKQFGPVEQVPWYSFWDKFPSKLNGTLRDDAQVEGLCALLAEEGRREALQRAVERSDRDTLSVWELRKSFNETDGLLTQVCRLLDGQGLPPPPPHYAGREAEAEALVTVLQQRSILLHGPGGMGKSSLAADVATRMLHAGAVASRALWVDLREAWSAEEVEARFCAALGLQLEESDNAPTIVAAVRRLAAKDGGDGGPASAGAVAVVMVVDNAEDALLQPEAVEALRGLLGKVLFEAPTVRLLVTSRKPLGEGLGLEERRVGAISPEAATQVLQKAVAGLSHAEAADGAKACHGVPLVLSLAAGILAASKLTLLEDLHSIRAAARSADEDAASNVVRLALGCCGEPLKQAAARLAVFPSAFDGKSAATVLGAPVKGDGPTPEAALDALLKRGLLQRADGQQYVMHTIVRQQAAELGAAQGAALRREAEGRYVTLMLGLLRSWSARFKTANVWRLALAAARDQQADLGRLYGLLQGLTPEHGLDVAAVALELTGQVADLLAALGLVRQMQGPCEALLAQLEPAGPGAAELPPDVEKAVASVLYMLGVVHLTDGRYADAEAATQRSLDLRRHALGPEHRDTIASMSSLAGCHEARGHLPHEAEHCYRQALELRQRILGPEDPDTIASMGDLAGFLKIRGQYAEAEPRFRLALELGQRVLGPDHPNTIACTKNLANCLQARGRYAEAEPLYHRALELAERVLGPEHPDTVICINNLAGCIYARGRYEEAEPRYRQALELRQRILGPEHPDTITSMNNLAGCLQAQGSPAQLAQAEQLYSRALALRRRPEILGPEHPDTITSMNNLAGCLQAQGRFPEAESLYRDALVLRARPDILGPEHPDTITSMNNLAGCLQAQGTEARLQQAEQLYSQALALRERPDILGPEHPDTITSMNNLAGCLQAQDTPAQLERAEDLYSRALVLRRRPDILGPEHPDTIISMNNLAGCKQARGNHEQAAELYREALVLRQRVQAQGQNV
ncbi:hypothetical protein HYH03_014001 [Edaphochlamys debaryana]|uniref:ORC1/DEAH AAA+ ATPase domain-containing protein n=1 Tax=Edaphochlamys debaryana TaxID=47281 RepID=A0A836BU16_9CHLO|nr:hypothetical protein HYH03_014001 [Edaphochlamys debaryana]|eukprot:KAG2487434.1 hypothetical protein HYH03_014001 [Edaphochlamys debaryana]